ncbi:MAG: HEAT repeat domain-containing protein [Myxococcota bacterium]
MKRLVLLLLALSLSIPAWARPNNRNEAIRVLEEFFGGRMGVNQMVNRLSFLGEAGYGADELIAAYKKADPKLQGLILEGLVGLGMFDADTDKIFLRALDSGDVAQMITACRGLAKAKSPTAPPRLIELLAARQPAVRREAAKALGELGAAKAGAPLIAAAKKEEDLEVRLAMVVAVGRAGDKKQVPALEAMLAGDSETTRLAAAQALCLLGAKSGVQYANKLLASDQKIERLQGVLLFEGATAKVAGPPLKVALADPDHRVRSTAARVLAQGGDKSKVEWLVLESAKAVGEDRLPYEDQLEKLRLTDEARQEILKKAGLK